MNENRQELVVPTGEPNYSTRIAKLLHRIAANELGSFRQKQAFIFPFHVTEDFLRHLDSEVNEQLAGGPPEGGKIDFFAEIRFPDISTITFDEFARFLRKAGNSKDPESFEISWKKFSVDDEGIPRASEIAVSFVTEKNLVSEDTPPGQFHHASAFLHVSGSDQLWVEHTFSKLVPYIRSTKLSGIYRPLWIFRNTWFIQLTSQLISWTGMILGIRIAFTVFEKESRLSNHDLFTAIKAMPNIADKLDALADRLLNPVQEPMWHPIVALFSGGACYVILLLVLQNVLPMLTPRSIIAIGLSSRRAQDYMNVFRFCIVTVGITGFVIPIIRWVISLFF